MTDCLPNHANCEKKRYPSWAPPSVIDLRKEWASLCSSPSLHVKFPRDIDLEILDRLLESHDMKEVWREIINLAGNSSDEAVANFAYNVCLIKLRWDRSPKKTRVKLRSEIKRAARHAEDLADELAEMKLDVSIAKLLDSAHRENTNQPAVVEDLNVQNAARLTSFIVVLRQFASSLVIQANKVSPISGQPNRSTAEKTHFIRALERYLRHQFGRPMHVQISIVSGAYFEGPPLLYTEVSSICYRGRRNK